MSQNPLVSAQRADASAIQIQLHPLVLLTISDYITRHSLRRQEGPIAGAIIGQQNGREITLEHAFECNTILVEGQVLFEEAWFRERLDQYKLVHKSPQLDLVGWFTLTPASGPQEAHLPIHRQILERYNDSAVLLAFHPSAVSSDNTAGGKLPLTIYETFFEGPEDASRIMEVERETHTDRIKFRELGYSIETGEAEMIGVDSVARGSGNATSVNGHSSTMDSKSGEMDIDAKSVKGKEKGQSTPDDKDAKKVRNVPSSEDEELITNLTSKANAVKMLRSRIQILIKYLENLPPSYLNAESGADISTTEASGDFTEINHTILRSINALVNRLQLVMPTDRELFGREIVAEKSDVSLVTLLGSLNRSVKDVREVGRKHGAVESERNNARKKHTVNDDSFLRFGGAFADIPNF